MMFLLCTVAIGLLLFIVLRVWVSLPTRVTGYGKISPPLLSKGRKCRTLVVLGSGGHTTEMFRLLKALDCTAKYEPRIYVHANTDKMSRIKLEVFEGELQIEKRKEANGNSDVVYQVLTIPRSREVRQGAVMAAVNTIRATVAAFFIMFQGGGSKIPDLLLTNGPGTCVPLCLAAYVARILGLKRVHIVYVESICRVESLSMTGKIMYFLADGLLVQWKQLVTKYPGTEYLGRLY